MVTIKEIKSELRHRKRAEQIQECQSSGQTVKEWCKGIGISPSTYYNRLRAVREEMLSRQPKLQEIVPVSVSMELTETNAVLSEKSSFSDKPKSTEKIIIRKNGTAVKILKHFDMIDKFDIISGVDIILPKTKEQLLSDCLEKSGTKAVNAVLIGDYDAIGAEKAGIDFI